MRRLYNGKGFVEFASQSECILRLSDSGNYITDMIISEKPYPIVRYLFLRYVNDIPEGMKLERQCSNPHCVNQAHYKLVAGEDVKFSQDEEVNRFTKRKTRKGSSHPGSKLNDDIVRDIKTSQLTTAQLAFKYSVSKVTISKIRNGKMWAHVIVD